jgi:hypothetical protein
MSTRVSGGRNSAGKRIRRSAKGKYKTTGPCRREIHAGKNGGGEKRFSGYFGKGAFTTLLTSAGLRAIQGHTTTVTL